MHGSTFKLHPSNDRPQSLTVHPLTSFYLNSLRKFYLLVYLPSFPTSFTTWLCPSFPHTWTLINISIYSILGCFLTLCLTVDVLIWCPVFSVASRQSELCSGINTSDLSLINLDSPPFVTPEIDYYNLCCLPITDHRTFFLPSILPVNCPFPSKTCIPMCPAFGSSTSLQSV